MLDMQRPGDSSRLAEQQQAWSSSAGMNHSEASFSFSPDFTYSVQDVISALKDKHERLQSEGTASQMLQKLEQAWDKLNAAPAEQSDLVFVFKDGPVTQAAKLGHPLFLEDFDLPSQAATERLNSLLESEPTFAVTEDVTHADTSIQLPPTFQVFASVHKDRPGQSVNISAATKSRFTEIQVAPYTEPELQQLVREELQSRLGGTDHVDSIVHWMFELHKEMPVAQSSSSTPGFDIRQLFHWIQFIASQSQAPSGQQPLLSWEQRVLLGARFLLFDEAHASVKTAICSKYPALFGATSTPSWVGAMFEDPTTDSLYGQTPFALAYDGQSLQLRYTQVAAALQTAMQPDAHWQKELVESRMFCSVTSTLVKNMARIFATLSAKSPLLLEGPPGIGKTAVISQANPIPVTAHLKFCVSALHCQLADVALR